MNLKKKPIIHSYTYYKVEPILRITYNYNLKYLNLLGCFFTLYESLIIIGKFYNIRDFPICLLAATIQIDIRKNVCLNNFWINIIYKFGHNISYVCIVGCYELTFSIFTLDLYTFSVFVFFAPLRASVVLRVVRVYDTAASACSSIKFKLYMNVHVYSRYTILCIVICNRLNNKYKISDITIYNC